MLWAFLIIAASVAGGTLLAFLPAQRESWVGPMRSFALTAALSVVLVHLLPEAFEGAGARTLVALALGFVLPSVIGHLGAWLWRAREGDAQPRDLALEASYFGLVLHHVGDGLGLGAYTGELLSQPGSGSVITALAAHVVPVVAIVVLTFDAVRGRGHALARALGLALASMVGVVLAGAVPGGLFAQASPWVAALVGGTLLHVVSHDLDSQAPRTPSARSWDLSAGVLGVLVSFVGGDVHASGGPPLSELCADRFVEFGVEAAPWVLLALAVGTASVARAAGSWLAAFDQLCRRFGPWLLAGTFALAWLDVLVAGSVRFRPLSQQHQHPLWLTASAGVLCLVLLRSAWLAGLRAWLGGLLGAVQRHEHGDHPGHAH